MNWYWNDVGPFASREAAITDAQEYVNGLIEAYEPGETIYRQFEIHPDEETGEFVELSASQGIYDETTGQWSGL